MRLIGKKTLVILSMSISLLGGLMVRFVGGNDILFAIVGSAMTGFAAGSVPAANYAALAEIAPENMRDKVCGWSDALCTLGMMLVTFLAGIWAADGDWTRAFNVYYILIPVILAAIVLYPKTNEAAEPAASSSGTSEKEAQEASVFPKVVMVLIVIKFVSALFYMSLSYNVSDLVINEFQLGTSTLVGTAGTLSSLVTMLGSLFVFVWMKFFKGASTLAGLVVMGAFMLFIAMFPTVPGVIAGWMLMSVGMNSYHSSNGTVVAMSTKGKSVGVASGLFVGATFLGEALCVYVTPWFSNLIFGSTLPSACLKTAGIFCILLGVIAYPFFRKAYKIAFPAKQSTSEQTEQPQKA